MSFYDFDIATNIVQLLSPDKRRSNNVAIAKSLIAAPLQWAHDLLFNTYYLGASCPNYSAGTYNYQDEVIYNKKVYSSLINGNTDLATTSNWLLVSDNFLGVKERVLYSSNKLVLEYALNKEYSTTFRQPNDPVTPSPSDIYITNLAAILTGFRVGQTEAGSSSIGATTASASIGGSSPFVYVNNFQINIPTSLATSLGANYQSIIKNFVSQYIAAGLRYTIVTY